MHLKLRTMEDELRSYFHEYKKNLESVVFPGKRVPALEDPEEDVSVDLTATMNMSEETLWKHAGFDVIKKCNVYS